MFIGIGNIIPIIKRQLGGGSPPVQTFNILAENNDQLITEAPIGNEDNMVTEQAP